MQARPERPGNLLISPSIQHRSVLQVRRVCLLPTRQCSLKWLLGYGQRPLLWSFPGSDSQVDSDIPPPNAVLSPKNNHLSHESPPPSTYQLPDPATGDESPMLAYFDSSADHGVNSWLKGSTGGLSRGSSRQALGTRSQRDAVRRDIPPAVPHAIPDDCG